MPVIDENGREQVEYVLLVVDNQYLGHRLVPRRMHQPPEIIREVSSVFATDERGAAVP